MRARPSVFLLWFWLAPLAPVWGGVTYLDLSAAANRGPTDPFDQSFPDAQDSVQKNGLASFPVGDRTFRGIPFRLLDPAKNDGRSFVALKGRERPDFPQAVTLKGPGGGVKDLYFLQTCHWGGTAPHITVAQYEVSYADGQGVTIPLHVGREFTNFWGADDTTESFLAWYYRYKNSTMGVNLFAWKNPRPGQAIQTVVFRSLSKMPVPLLFAVTASSEDLPVSPVSPKPEPTAVTDTQGWAAPASGDPSAPPAVDLSGFLDAPAGKHGPVTVKAGSLVFADGTGARFWGTRLLPGVLSMDGAALGDLAARLAADGFNLAEVDLPEGDAPTDAATPAPGPPAGLEALLGALKAKGVYLLVKAPEGSSEGASLDDPAVLPEGIFSVLEAAYNPVPTGAPAPVALQNGPQLLGLADSLPAQLILGRAFG
ncbi:MAG TPA: hypothetical protein VFR02_00600, partial [bacterium]|nr:hypothetical protein [bacterium]